MRAPVLYCGDPHGQFAHIIRVSAEIRPSAVILLGDMEPAGPLVDELAALDALGIPYWFIPGNHDADDAVAAARVFDPALADRNANGRVVTLPDGTRLAGLGGVFREAVWNPRRMAGVDSSAKFRSRSAHAKATPRQNRWREGPHVRHLGSIYPDELDQLCRERADILVTHEAPGYHPHGFHVLDALAQALGVRLAVHGHHHDQLDSSGHWAMQGFKSFGVGLRGITAIDLEGNANIIVTGE